MRGSILGDDENDPEIFPWEDVRAAQHNTRLQKKNDVAAARSQHLSQAQPCPKCGATAAELSWIFFSSPKWTWEHLCGRAGYLTICEPCNWQVEFFLTMLN